MSNRTPTQHRKPPPDSFIAKFKADLEKGIRTIEDFKPHEIGTEDEDAAWRTQLASLADSTPMPEFRQSHQHYANVLTESTNVMERLHSRVQKEVPKPKFAEGRDAENKKNEMAIEEGYKYGDHRVKRRKRSHREGNDVITVADRAGHDGGGDAYVPDRALLDRLGMDVPEEGSEQSPEELIQGIGSGVRRMVGDMPIKDVDMELVPGEEMEAVMGGGGHT